MQAFHISSTSSEKPCAVIAKTYKGRGFPDIEDKENWHGKPLGTNAANILKEIENLIQNKAATTLAPSKPLCTAPDVDISAVKLDAAPEYKKGDKVATRQVRDLSNMKLWL